MAQFLQVHPQNPQPRLIQIAVKLLAAGGVMAVGQLLGARVGAGWVVKKGTRFIRPVFLTIVTLTIGRLAYIELTRPR